MVKRDKPREKRLMLVGLVPMGGFGERWAPYPCPKELLPFGREPDGRPRVIGDYVMARMALAGADLLIVPVRPEKATAVMSYFGHRYRGGPTIAYVAAPGPTLVANLQACLPLCEGHTVLFGMPDTYFTPETAYVSCLEALRSANELVLGCWLHPNPVDLDTVERDGANLRTVRPKPRLVDDDSKEVWGIAAWDPRFTDRMRSWSDQAQHNPGHVFRAAALEGKAKAILFSSDTYLDIAAYAPYEQSLRDGTAPHGPLLPLPGTAAR